MNPRQSCARRRYLADSFHASLYLVRGVATPPMAAEVDFSALRLELLNNAESSLRELKAKLGIDAPQVVTDRSIIEVVHEEATQRKAGLVVVGRGQAQTHFGRFWSLLYPIVREAPCPVLQHLTTAEQRDLRKLLTNAVRRVSAERAAL